jgi:arabinogalactan endo-1,4-beta-galactosidase
LFKEVYEIDENGYLIDNYLMSEEQIQEETQKGRIFVEGWYSQSFYKPRYDFEKKAWIEEAVEEDLLDIHKENKINELRQKCSETILGRFYVELNGTSYGFSNDAEAQANFEKCARVFDKGLATEMVWTVYDIEGSVSRLPLTEDLFNIVYMAHLNHINDNIAKFRDFLSPMVLFANTLEEINQVTWN